MDGDEHFSYQHRIYRLDTVYVTLRINCCDLSTHHFDRLWRPASSMWWRSTSAVSSRQQLVRLVLMQALRLKRGLPITTRRKCFRQPSKSQTRHRAFFQNNDFCAESSPSYLSFWAFIATYLHHKKCITSCSLGQRIPMAIGKMVSTLNNQPHLHLIL